MSHHIHYTYRPYVYMLRYSKWEVEEACLQCTLCSNPNMFAAKEGGGGRWALAHGKHGMQGAVGHKLCA